MTGEFTVAVHALVYLNHKAVTLDSEALAENVCTNPARVRKVMAKLKKAGIVSTQEGANGGYRMAKEAEEVNLRQICEALDLKAVSSSWRSGSPELDCLIASGMAPIMENIYGELDELCKKRMEAITIQTINDQIF